MIQQIISREQLEKDFPKVYFSIVETHDQDVQYIENCLTNGNNFQDDHIQETLKRLNEIRAFFGDQPLTKQSFEQFEEIEYCNNPYCLVQGCEGNCKK